MTTAPAGSPADSVPQRPGLLGFVMRHPWFIGVALGIVALTAMRGCQSRRLGELPALSAIPDFTLTTQANRPITGKDLDHKVWIASFFFTSCQTTCPAIMDAMRDVNARLRAALPNSDQIQLVSFSVDPEFDTPTELTRYATERHYDLSRWTLVTGPRKDLEAVVIGGFQTAVGDKVKKGDIMDIAHSMKLVLVDDQRHIRHYFSATDPNERELLVAYAVQLTQDAATQKASETAP